jgi:hypothetical protein
MLSIISHKRFICFCNWFSDYFMTLFSFIGYMKSDWMMLDHSVGRVWNLLWLILRNSQALARKKVGKTAMIICLLTGLGILLPLRCEERLLTNQLSCPMIAKISFPHRMYTGTRDSSVSIVTRPWTERPRNQGLISDKRQEVFLFTVLTPVLGSCTLFNGYWSLFPVVKAALSWSWPLTI